MQPGIVSYLIPLSLAWLFMSAAVKVAANYRAWKYRRIGPAPVPGGYRGTVYRFKSSYTHPPVYPMYSIYLTYPYIPSLTRSTILQVQILALIIYLSRDFLKHPTSNIKSNKNVFKC